MLNRCIFTPQNRKEGWFPSAFMPFQECFPPAGGEQGGRFSSDCALANDSDWKIFFRFASNLWPEDFLPTIMLAQSEVFLPIQRYSDRKIFFRFASSICPEDFLPTITLAQPEDFLPTTALTQPEDFLPMIRQKAKKPTARSHTGNRLR